MANTLNTLAGALVLQRALQLVFTKRPFLGLISRNLFDDQGMPGTPAVAKYNQTIYSRIRTVPTVSNFSSTADNYVTTDVPVTMNNFKQVYFSFGATEYGATDRDLINESADPIATALANAIFDAVAALWISANYGGGAQKSIQLSGWGYTNTLLVLRQALMARGVPDDGKRFFVGNSAVCASLLGDQTVVNAYNSAVSGISIATGHLPIAAGFQIDEYPAIPTATNQVGFAGHVDSAVYAVRAPANPMDFLPGAQFPGNFGYIVEPRYGLTMCVNQWIGTDLSINNRICFMYGAAVGQSASGQQLVTA